MISKLKENVLLKKYYRKPSFLDNSFINSCKILLLKNKKESFFKKLRSKKLPSSKIFLLYFYLEYLLEKENKQDEFLLSFINKVLFQKMQCVHDIIIDKEIYFYLKKNDLKFKDFKNKQNKKFITIDKNYIKLVNLLNNLELSTSKNVCENIDIVINYLKKLIKEKKLNKKLANNILEQSYFFIRLEEINSFVEKYI
jgi:hypothetical protein